MLSLEAAATMAKGDGVARRAAGYKGVDSKVHPKGSYERRRVCDEERLAAGKEDWERERIYVPR